MDSFEVEKLDVMGIQETHTEGCGVIGSESEVWEWMEGRRSGVVWNG